MAQASDLVCAHCGARVAACYGSYDGGPPCFACDSCCGHGCEDGRCVSLRELLIWGKRAFENRVEGGGLEYDAFLALLDRLIAQ